MRHRYPLADLRAAASPEYFEALLEAGQSDGQWLWLETDTALRLKRQFEPRKTKETPKVVWSKPTVTLTRPYVQWPEWAKAVAWQRRDGEVGVGDTVERLITPMLSKGFRAAFKAVTGMDCGCSRRQEAWNIFYRYGDATDSTA